MTMPYWKYRPYETVDLPDRTWPDRVVDRAPIWCSTDLRDGNQALDQADGRRRASSGCSTCSSRSGSRRSRSASRRPRRPTSTSCARLVEEDLIPADTTIAVLTQARPELIERTYEAIDGRAARDRAPLQLDLGDPAARRLPARQGRDHRPRGARRRRSARSSRRRRTTEIVFEYSPESFHGTELDYALEICEAVIAEWGPTREEKMIVNLPTTVEAFPPNVYADRLEWFQRHVSARDADHPQRPPAQRPRHRRRDRRARADGGRRARRGDALRQRRAHRQRRSRHARAEPASPRASIPGLDLSRIDEAQARSSRSATSCRSIRAIRTPASSSTRRSRARTRMRSRRACTRSSARESELWDVPVPRRRPDGLGRTYEAIIRVNSQSGKGGVAYLMETEHHLELPRGLQVDFAQKVQAITDARGDELTADELLAAFHEHYLAHTRPYELVSLRARERRGRTGSSRRSSSTASRRRLAASGNGPIAALVEALRAAASGSRCSVRDYHEHAMAASARATAAAYVEADVDDDAVWGVGLHPSIVTASLRAVVNAVNRALALREARRDRERALRRLASRRREPAEPGQLGRQVEAERQEHERVERAIERDRDRQRVERRRRSR